MFEQITSVLVGTFDFVFSPISILQPHISLTIISIFLTIIVILINRFSVDRKLMKEIKERMSEIRENLTNAQKEGNREQINKFLSEMMKVNNEYMRHSFKALLISGIIVALFLPWLKYKYSALTVASLPFNLPLIGSQLGWIGWYILVSFTIGWVIRKIIEGE